MNSAENRAIVKVSASAFKGEVGGKVKKGEVMGRYAGKDVEAPFNAIVEGVSFDSDSHTLQILLVREDEQSTAPKTDTAKRREVVKVSTTVIRGEVGDEVKEGEIIGHHGGKEVKAPFDATIESISFDSDDHSLLIGLAEN